MKRFKILNTKYLFVNVLLFLSTTINAQNNLTLENVLAITLKENIDIKIKTNELNQVENYE